MTPSNFGRMFHPTLDKAYRLFDTYNQTLFARRLPKTKIELSKKMTSAAGKVVVGENPLIRLSEPLLDQEKKFHNTLVHEMIHICQLFVEKTSERPHGPYFSAWMHAINQIYQFDTGYVRSPFGNLKCQGTAKLKLNITVTHNYHGEQTTERQNLVGKIKKLLALTDSPYEHEAQAALLKAQALMQSHAVSDDELEKSEEGSELELPIIRELFVTGKRVPVYWKRSLLMVLSKFYKCQYIQCSGQGIGVYGHRPYVEIVRHLFDYYEAVIEQMAQPHQGEGTVFLNNFRSGIVDRLNVKLMEKQTEPCLADLAESGRAPIQANTNETQIIRLQAEANELSDFINWINPGFYNRKGTVSYVKLNKQAMKKGYESGKQLSVNEQMAPSTKKLKPAKGFGR